ncbi:MAG: sigma-70 family RNA polymerase sigma factor [Chitinophagaceae bacterium]|nr:sigma-70 family RNA polymerase sigma factor [Chitinophagaceae bacterium]
MQKDPFAHISDQDLLEKFKRDQDSQWLGILFQRYTLMLLGVCMKYLKNEEAAKDAVQQVFLKAITELQKYQVDYIKSWLYTIARNHCLMQLRDKTHLLSVSEEMNLSEAPLLQVTAIEKEQTFIVLEQSINELNAPQKTCVTLFYLQKRSYQEIVDSTGFSLLQVKSYIQNGKRNLKLIVTQKLQQE